MAEDSFRGPAGTPDIFQKGFYVPLQKHAGTEHSFQLWALFVGKKKEGPGHHLKKGK